jgi:hypothetical protein
MAESILKKTVVTLSTIDEPNLIPVFNSYCWAALLVDSESTEEGKPLLPSMSKDPFFLYFEKAGICVDRGIDYYTIINTDKGGIIYHFPEDCAFTINAGVVVKKKNKHFGSPQSGSRVNISDDKKSIEIISSIGPMPKSRPGPWQFLILRVCSVTVFKSFLFREWVKKGLVKFLIAEKRAWPINTIRKIELGKSLKFEDQTFVTDRFRVIKHITNFVPIHMASQGYWQIQDENDRDSNETKI